MLRARVRWSCALSLFESARHCCAAGTGAFLDSVAVKLNVPVEDMVDRVNFSEKWYW